MNYMTNLAYRYGITQEHAFRYLAYILLGIVLGYTFLALKSEYLKGLQWDKINYNFYFKYQLKQYRVFILSAAVFYGITIFFGIGKPIVLTMENIAAFVSGSLSFIFLGAYIIARQNPFNK